ncbi:aminoacylase 1-like protein 2 [Trametes elegans]|nr:aminoacylase 1-like protein 2 [Trametes elegans]
MSTNFWQPGDDGLNAEAVERGSGEVYRPEFLASVKAALAALNDDLFALSQDIHDHPETRFEEHHAHDALTAFVEKQGFEVTRHYLLDTAWVAKYTRGTGGRTLGVNSEMDALPGIGHACGHNLIAIAGVAVACAVKATLDKFNIAGTVVLLGTPGEEGGAGKVILLERGAYGGLDACLMCHPAPGPKLSASLSSCLARQRIDVEFFGHTAHAAFAPWEGQNALDAAVLSYTNISMLRQQLKPSHRVHGIFEGKDWTPNVIPDYAKMMHVDAAVERVRACFEGAALATNCRVKIDLGHSNNATFDLRQNKALGDEFGDVFSKTIGPIDYEYGISSASTDFVTLPALHPGYAIPATGANHTIAFTEAAATKAAHKATLNVVQALAATGLRVLTDDDFYQKVRETFEEDKRQRERESANAKVGPSVAFIRLWVNDNHFQRLLRRNNTSELY